MSIQKLHYENLGGILIRREGLLTWRCPLCKAEGQSPEAMRTCPECGSKEAPLPGAQPAPRIPDDVMRDAKRYRFLRAAKNIPISTEAARDPIVYDAAIDAAMLAAAQEANP